MVENALAGYRIFLLGPGRGSRTRSSAHTAARHPSPHAATWSRSWSLGSGQGSRSGNHSATSPPHWIWACCSARIPPSACPIRRASARSDCTRREHAPAGHRGRVLPRAAATPRFVRMQHRVVTRKEQRAAKQVQYPALCGEPSGRGFIFTGNHAMRSPGDETAQRSSRAVTLTPAGSVGKPARLRSRQANSASIACH